MTKICNRCKEEKSLTSFFKDKLNLTDGHYSICKDCKMASTNRWRNNNREYYNNQMKLYRRDYREKINRKRKVRAYGLTETEYLDMVKAQDNKCAICECGPKKTRPLAIDHDHETKQIRGLLCYNCNRGMHYIDKSEWIQKALKYKSTK